MKVSQVERPKTPVFKGNLRKLVLVMSLSVFGHSNANAALCPGPPPLTTTDTDGDGYDDSIDLFINDPLRHYDYDLDGISNLDDDDDDGDGVPDVVNWLVSLAITKATWN